jgi:phage terminase large subunit-like protein
MSGVAVLSLAVVFRLSGERLPTKQQKHANEMAEPYLQYPTSYTPPLSTDFTTDGDRLLEFVDKYWIDADTGKPIKLLPFQRWLIRSILETYPPGHPQAGLLRYKQVVVSMGRQNGKSLLAAILSLYGLFQHTRAPLVIGIAPILKQATIVYNRSRYVVNMNPALKKKVKATGTRGLMWRDGRGMYDILTGKGDALQGSSITLGIADELHILKPEAWDAMLEGAAAQKRGLIIGITTAGDSGSTLLNRLYKQGEQAIEGNDEQFGFFLWEGPEGASIDDDEAIMIANPAIAAGFKSIENIKQIIKGQPRDHAERFTFNRFVAAIDSWLPPYLWKECEFGLIDRESKPRPNPIALSVDISKNWKWASLVVAAKDKETGILTTELYRQIENPTPEILVEAVLAFKRKNYNVKVIMDSQSLKSTAEQLDLKGCPVKLLSSYEVANACEQAFAMLSQKRVKHDHDDLITDQVLIGKKKNLGDRWAISRTESVSDIDGLMATVFALYLAENTAQVWAGLS